MVSSLKWRKRDIICIYDYSELNSEWKRHQSSVSVRDHVFRRKASGGSWSELTILFLKMSRRPDRWLYWLGTLRRCTISKSLRTPGPWHSPAYIFLHFCWICTNSGTWLKHTYSSNEIHKHSRKHAAQQRHPMAKRQCTEATTQMFYEEILFINTHICLSIPIIHVITYITRSQWFSSGTNTSHDAARPLKHLRRGWQTNQHPSIP